MKAITLSTYGSPDQLELKDLERPSPKEDEVLIRVCAASVNDWDWCVVRGKPFYIRLLCGLFRPKVAIPGVDIAGYVESVGRAVKTFQPGDAVYGDLSECGFGGFAEYVCAAESALAHIPPEMSFHEAAGMPHAAMLAVQGLFDVGRLEPHHRVLINGAGGGVGTLAVQIARSIGVEDITGVDHRRKLSMMRSIGFQKCIDYMQDDFTDTDQNYDLILDTKTNRSIFHYLRALTPNGIYVTVGGDTAKLLQMALLAPITHKFSKKRVRIVNLKPNKNLAYMNELYQDGGIKPVIGDLYPLSEAPKAIQHFGNGEHQGKVVITVHEPKC